MHVYMKRSCIFKGFCFFCVVYTVFTVTVYVGMCRTITAKYKNKSISHKLTGDTPPMSVKMCNMLFGSGHEAENLTNMTDNSTVLNDIANLSLSLGTAKRSGWVSARLVGKLGNHLFILASSFGIAYARNAQWCIVNDNENLAYDMVEFLDGKGPMECPPGIQFDFLSDNDRFQHFDETLCQRNPGSNVTVATYLQSFRYFSGSGLPFRQKHTEWAQGWIAQRNINVGIHIRRGDMLEPGGVDIYNVASIQYFRNALSMLHDMTDGNLLGFVISTDDIEWVRSNGEFSNMTILEGYTPAQSMSILAACKHTIMSVGTFGWWSTFLRREKGYTFYYDKPYKTESNSVAKQGYDPEDHFPANWIPLSDDHVSLPTTHKCHVTFVSCYFEVPSKHTDFEYTIWMQNLLNSSMCLVIFTDDASRFKPSSTELVRVVDMRNEIHVFNQSTEFWERQLSIDSERDIHRSYKLYWIWNLKSVFLNRVALENPFASEYFFWLDIGCVREPMPDFDWGSFWPPAAVMREHRRIFVGNPQAFENGDNAETSFEHTNRLAGAIWGGHATAIPIWTARYTTVFRDYVAKGRFVGKDQNQMATVCVTWPDMCRLVVPQAGFGDIWFVMLPFLRGEIQLVY